MASRKTVKVKQQRSPSGRFACFLYRLLNQFLILFLLAPSAILVWRGGWKLFDEFLFPGEPLVSAGVSCAIGFSFMASTFLFVEWKNAKWKLYEKHKEWRMFLYPLSFSVLHAWRGIWMFLDWFIPTNGAALLGTHFGSLFVLCLTKTVSNTMFIPSFFASDNAVTPFQIGTVWGTAASNVSKYLKIVDYAFTMFPITIFTVTFWRSTWTAMNVYVFPNYPVFSNLFSVLVAYIVVVSGKLATSILKSTAFRSSSVVAFLIQFLFCYSMGLAAVALWRGLWQLLDLFLFPAGILVLYVGRSISNLLGCPCGTRVDSLETLSGLDTTLGAIVSCPTTETREDAEALKPFNEAGEKKQLVVYNTSDSVTTTFLISD